MTTHRTSTFPNAIGVPGGSVEGLRGKFGAAQSRAGTSGEILTARALKDYCKPGGPTVLHDLVLPMGGVDANIDHVIVSGRDIRILDSKMWKPGVYWTLFGSTRRALTRVDYADKQTMKMAQTAIAALLGARFGNDYRIRRPMLVVWPSSTKAMLSVRGYRPVSAGAVRGSQIKFRHRRLLGTKPADPEIVAALVPLVISMRAQSSPSRSRFEEKARPWVRRSDLPTFESDEF